MSLPSLAGLSLDTGPKRKDREDTVADRKVLPRGFDASKQLNAVKGALITWSGDVLESGPLGYGRLRIFNDRSKSRLAKDGRDGGFFTDYPWIMTRWVNIDGFIMIDGSFDGTGNLHGKCQVAVFTQLFAGDVYTIGTMKNASFSELYGNTYGVLHYTSECTYDHGHLEKTVIEFGDVPLKHDPLFVRPAASDRITPKKVTCSTKSSPTTTEYSPPPSVFAQSNVTIDTEDGQLSCTTSAYSFGFWNPIEFRSLVFNGLLETVIDRKMGLEYKGAGEILSIGISMPFTNFHSTVVRYALESGPRSYQGSYSIGAGMFGHGNVSGSESGMFWANKLCGMMHRYGGLGSAYMRGSKLPVYPNLNFAKYVAGSEHLGGLHLMLDGGISEPLMDMFQTTDVSQLSRTGNDVIEPCKDAMGLRPVLVYSIASNARGTWNYKDYIHRRDNAFDMRFIKCKEMSTQCARTDEPFTRFADGLRSDLNEKVLFHGTDWPSALSIARSGFSMSKKGRGLYGSGFYFADDVAKPDQYATSMSTQAVDSLGLPEQFQFDDEVVGARCNSNLPDGATSYYAMLVSRVTLGCSATVTLDSFRKNKTVDGKQLFSNYVPGCGPGNCMAGFPHLATMQWDSVVTHHDSRPFGSAAKFRYREFVAYDTRMILPTHVVIYTRITKRDPGSYGRSFDIGSESVEDDYYCESND